MPLRSILRTRRPYKRRTTTRKNYKVPSTKTPTSASRRTRISVPRGLPISDSYKCCLSYNQVIHWNQAGGGAVSQTFNANNIYDPDKTGTGTQPYLSDQLFALYHRVLVIGCSYTAQFMNNDTVVLTDICGIFATAELGGTTTPRFAREIPFSKVKTVGPKQSGSGTKWISDGISMDKLFGTTGLHPGNNDYTHTDGGGPAQDGFLQFIVQPLDQASTVDMYANIKICYKCIFFDRKTQTQS